MPVTQFPVTPYLNACGPPALRAMLPPICENSAAPGSGGNRRPLSRASRARAGRHTGLDMHPPEERIELPHAIQPVEADHDAALDRHRAPGEPVPPPRGVSGTSCSYTSA